MLRAASIATIAVALLVAAPLARAQGPELPHVKAPALFDEGTETRISNEDLKSLESWANDAKVELREVLEATRWQNYHDQKADLVRAMQTIVQGSQGKQAEQLMRFVLNRALKIVADLEREGSDGEVGMIDQQVRVLKLSAELAIKYHQSDLDFLRASAAGKTDVELPYARFGVEYARFLMAVNESILDASAQYDNAVMALGLLQWDLYRDKDRLKYAPVIKRISSYLEGRPASAQGMRDSEAVKRMPELRRTFKRAQEMLAEIDKGLVAAATPDSSPDEGPAAFSEPKRPSGDRSANFIKGKTVYDRTSENWGQGTVIASFTNGTIQVNFSGYVKERSADQLGYEVSRFGNLAKDVNVLDLTSENFGQGKIVVVFDDGVSIANFSGYLKVRKADGVAYEVRSDNGVVQGIGALDLTSENWGHGTVTRVFSGGHVVVDFSGYSKQRRVSQISREVSTIGGARAGSVAIDSTSEKWGTGRVVHVYANGSAMINFSGYNKLRSPGGFAVEQ